MAETWIGTHSNNFNEDRLLELAIEHRLLELAIEHKEDKYLIGAKNLIMR